jgi:hypothetical protein
MKCSIIERNHEMCQCLEEQSYQLYEIGAEIRSEYPDAASFLFFTLAYIHKSYQISANTITQKLTSIPISENTEALVFMDDDLFEELSQELYSLASELDAEHQNAASILCDVVTFILGENSFSAEVIKQKLISLSLSENNLQLNDRFNLINNKLVNK